jgi:hypothetical protein
VPINRRTARSNRDEPPSGSTGSESGNDHSAGWHHGDRATSAARSVRAFEKPEPPGGGRRLEWERKVDPVAGIGFMVARGTYHARIDAKHDGWRWSVWTNSGRVAGEVAPTSGLAEARSRTCSSALSKRGDCPPIQGRGSARDRSQPPDP